VQKLDQGSGAAPPRKPEQIVPLFGAFGFALATLLALQPRSAFADDAAPPTLAGTWSASAMTEAWSTQSWGDACGPKPLASGAPAGTVTVTDQGSELSFSGAGRSASTASCWDPTPGLQRTNHSKGKRGWSSTCASPAGDPRRAL